MPRSGQQERGRVDVPQAVKPCGRERLSRLLGIVFPDELGHQR
jgi:hypothetical protein